MPRATSSIIVGVIATLAAVGIGLAAPAHAETSLWGTEHGPLTLDITTGDRVTGGFPQYEGRFFGILDRSTGTVRGSWVRPTTAVRCAIDVGGSFYWGRVAWRLGEDGAMNGRWSYCDQPEGSGGQWNGLLETGVNPLEVATIDEGEPPPEEPTTPNTGDDAAALAAARAVWNKQIDPSRLNSTRADVTCDGVPDLVMTHLDRESPEGPFLSVGVVEGGAAKRVLSPIYLDFTGMAFASLCGKPKLVKSEIRTVKASQATELTGLISPPLCTRGLRLDDGECDAIWVFTNPKTGGGFDLVIGRR